MFHLEKVVFWQLVISLEALQALILCVWGHFKTEWLALSTHFCSMDRVCLTFDPTDITILIVGQIVQDGSLKAL